jgi:hypothetical protein
MTTQVLAVIATCAIAVMFVAWLLDARPRFRTRRAKRQFWEAFVVALERGKIQIDADQSASHSGGGLERTIVGSWHDADDPDDFTRFSFGIQDFDDGHRDFVWYCHDAFTCHRIGTDDIPKDDIADPTARAWLMLRRIADRQRVIYASAELPA